MSSGDMTSWGRIPSQEQSDNMWLLLWQSMHNIQHFKLSKNWSNKSIFYGQKQCHSHFRAWASDVFEPWKEIGRVLFLCLLPVTVRSKTESHKSSCEGLYANPLLESWKRAPCSRHAEEAFYYYTHVNQVRSITWLKWYERHCNKLSRSNRSKR